MAAEPAGDTSGPCIVCLRVSPARYLTRAPADRPMPHLCDEHWRDVQTDWLLLGWCADHYGEALRFSVIHNRTIQPD